MLDFGFPVKLLDFGVWQEGGSAFQGVANLYVGRYVSILCMYECMSVGLPSHPVDIKYHVYRERMSLVTTIFDKSRNGAQRQPPPVFVDALAVVSSAGGCRTTPQPQLSCSPILQSPMSSLSERAPGVALSLLQF